MMIDSSGMNYFLFQNQGHAEDWVMYHRYLYYVLGKPELSDKDYDSLERGVKAQWRVSIVDEPASDRMADYPCYIRENRRPNWIERAERDERIMQRWLDNI